MACKRLKAYLRGGRQLPEKKSVRPVRASQIDAVMPFVAPAVAAMIRILR
jgi:hypothetical protein